MEHGFKLYLKYAANTDEPVLIYVLGSIHMDGGVAYRRSLSSAGTIYLMELGAPSESLYGDEVNIRFKDEEGVYNSSDECFVASQL